MNLSADCALHAVNKQALRTCWRNWCGSSILRAPCVRVVAPDELTGTASVDIEAPPASKFGDAYLPGGWTLKVSALALAAGAVLFGAAFGLKGGTPGQPKAPLFVAAVDGSTKAPQRDGEFVATSHDAGATPLKHITQPAAVKGVSSEQQPIELDDHASLGNAPPSAILAPTSAGAAQSTTGASSGPPAAVAINTPVVTPPSSAPPPTAPQFPDPKALRTLLLGPNGTQIATATPSAIDASEAAHASDGPQRPARPALKVTSGDPGVAQPSTHRFGLPAKLSIKPSARVVVARTEMATLDPEAEKAPPAPTDLQAAPEAATASAPQPAVKGVTSEEQPIELGNHAAPRSRQPGRQRDRQSRRWSIRRS
jgi:hypothetical protein